MISEGLFTKDVGSNINDRFVDNSRFHFFAAEERTQEELDAIHQKDLEDYDILAKEVKEEDERILHELKFSESRLL